MKNLFYSCLVVFFIQACTESTKQTAHSETFKSDTLHFSIQHPDTWEVIRNTEQADVITFTEIAQNDTNGFRESIVCRAEEMPMVISDSIYFQATVTEIKISNPGLEIQKKEKIQLGSNNFSTYTYTANKGGAVLVQGFCVVKGLWGYHFSCTALQKNAEVYGPVFKEILSTFKSL